jgi:hypothetical protein
MNVGMNVGVVEFQKKFYCNLSNSNQDGAMGEIK